MAFFIWLSVCFAGDEREEWEKHLTPEEAKRNGTSAGPLIAPREESLSGNEPMDKPSETAVDGDIMTLTYVRGTTTAAR